LSYERLL